METNEINERIKQVAHVIAETPGCRESVELAITDIQNAINLLLDNVDVHDLLHGNNASFMAANALHGLINQLIQIS